jgi:hypothetical protein
MKKIFFCFKFFLIFVSLIFCSGTILAENKKVVKIVVKDFVDQSNYQGRWNLGSSIAKYFKKSLDELGCYEIVTSTETEFVLSGRIKEFVLSSKSLTSYGIGGYQDYYAKVVLEIDLKNSKNKKLLDSVESKGELFSNNLNFSFLGGPTGLQDYKLQLEQLWSLPPESEEVRSSIIGHAIQESVDNILPKISFAIFGVQYGLKGEIKDKRADKVYIDIGEKDGVKIGDEFVVYSVEKNLKDLKKNKIIGFINSQVVGKIKITEVKGSSLAVGEIVSGQEKIKEKDIVILK